MFTILATILFFLLAIIWSSKSWTNLVFKLILIGMAFYGVWILLGKPTLNGHP